MACEDLTTEDEQQNTVVDFSKCPVLSEIATATDSPATRRSRLSAGIGIIPLIPQQNTWDCGLACVAMALSALNTFPTLDQLYQIVNTTSIWSIDLVFLLSQFSVPLCYTTTWIGGANPAYRSEQFYAENIEEDSLRVGSLFNKLLDSKVPIHRGTVPLQDVRHALSTNKYLVIALLDKSKLLSSLNSELMKSSYTGHYVLLIGYDCATDEFLVRDPSALDMTRIAAKRLEAARKSYGTDEDLVFIRVDTSTNNKR